MRTKEVVRGVKEFLPKEAALKREIENQAVETFWRWGYQEVVTPTFEYLEVIEAGAGESIRDELFLLQDRDGRMLALRPEMTIPIARMVSTKFGTVKKPLRLFYSANIFRHTQPQMGRYKEFYQLGVELIGVSGPRADAEVIALAAEIMEQQKLDFQISLNHIGIFNSLLAQSGLSEENREQIKQLTLKKDLVGLERTVSSLKMDPEIRGILQEIPVLHGGAELLGQLNTIKDLEGVDQALRELSEVYSLLECYGVHNRVVIDLGVLRGFDYYTGIVFEGYSPNLGYPLLGGGRYDNLLGKFDNPLDATGFAIGLERLLLALDQRKVEPFRRFMVMGCDWQAVLDKARELREQGNVVEIDIQNLDCEDRVKVVPL